MSEAAQLLGLPAVFVFEGKKYPLAERSLEVEALFEQWLEGESLMAIRRHSRLLGPVDYSENLEGWRRDCGSHAYAYGSRTFSQAMGSPPCLRKLAFLQLAAASPNDPTITEELVDRVSRSEPDWLNLQAAMFAGDEPAKKEGRAGPLAVAGA